VRFLGGGREEGRREPDARAGSLEQVGMAVGGPQKRGESMA
jgi:hypothetical protein